MNKQQLVEEIELFIEEEYVQECEFVTTLSTLEIGSKKAKNSFNDIDGMTKQYTTVELKAILDSLTSYAWENLEESNTETTIEIEEDLDQDVIISSVEANEVFNIASDLFENVELVDSEVIVIEDSIIPIQITHDTGLYLLEVGSKHIGYMELDELKSILKTLPD